jgi:cytochrome c biogenesis protein CcdA
LIGRYIPIAWGTTGLFVLASFASGQRWLIVAAGVALTLWGAAFVTDFAGVVSATRRAWPRVTALQQGELQVRAVGAVFATVGVVAAIAAISGTLGH